MPSRCFLIALLLFSSGCAWFGEDSPRARMNAMPGISRTLQSARTERPFIDEWPQQHWWWRFNDTTLSQLIQTALADNPDFKATEARLRQSQAMVDAQAAELYPTVDAAISFSAQRYSANSVQAKFAGENFRQLLINPLILRYHLDFWGRDEASLQGAVDRSLAVAAETADAKLLLAATVAGAYFDLQAATEKLAIAEGIVSDRTALAKLEQARFEHGLSGEAPVLQARIALNNAKQQQARLQAELELQRHVLATLIGQGPDATQHLQGQPLSALPLPSLPADLPLHLLSRRPDLTAARLHAEASAEEIKVAETAFYPDVNLIAFTGLHSVDLADIALQGSSLAYAVGPSIEFPVFEGGRLRANLSYQQSTYDAAVERYNASLVHAVQEVADALSHWREIEARLSAQAQSLGDAKTQQHLGETLARTGLGDQRQPLRTRLEANQERLSSLTLVAEQHKAAVRIFKALGGGYDASTAKSPKS